MELNPKKHKESRNIKSDWFDVFPLGNEPPGKRNWLDDVEMSYGINHGYTEKSVEYVINNWRYRGTVEPAMEQDAAFGCSYTFGTGSNSPWPELMNLANCGVAGGSNDLIARTAITYCKTFKPKNIFVMWTFTNRREHVDNKGLDRFRGISEAELKEEYKNPTWKTYHLMLNSKESNEYNFEKNKLLVESYCFANNINLIQLDVTTIPKRNYQLGRDKDHPGPDWHVVVAEELWTRLDQL